jgi:hypothetical protein
MYKSQSYELCNFLHLGYQSEQANWYRWSFGGNEMGREWLFQNFYVLIKRVGVAMTLWAHIWDDLFRISAETSAILSEVLRGFPQTFKTNAATVPRLGDNRFLQNPLKFIIHVLRHSSTLYNRRRWRRGDTPHTYSEHIRFQRRPGHRPHWPRFFVVFLNSSRHIAGFYLD